MNNPIRPALVTAAHSYTRSSEPWQVEEFTEADGSTAEEKTYGMRAFGTTIKHDIRSRRQTRFLIVFAVLFVVWACLLVF